MSHRRFHMIGHKFEYIAPLDIGALCITCAFLRAVDGLYQKRGRRRPTPDQLYQKNVRRPMLSKSRQIILTKKLK